MKEIMSALLLLSMLSMVVSFCKRIHTADGFILQNTLSIPSILNDYKIFIQHTHVSQIPENILLLNLIVPKALYVSKGGTCTTNGELTTMFNKISCTQERIINTTFEVGIGARYKWALA